jgi:hypothetical protein
VIQSLVYIYDCSVRGRILGQTTERQAVKTIFKKLKNMQEDSEQNG